MMDGWSFMEKGSRRAARFLGLGLALALLASAVGAGEVKGASRPLKYQS